MKSDVDIRGSSYTGMRGFSATSFCPIAAEELLISDIPI
jgi:hypothetical protein